jgi:hypothetical protein
MGENFGRSYEFIAGVSGRTGFKVTDLKIVFDIEKSNSQTPNQSKITLYNLSPSHRAILETRDCGVELKAGYGEAGPIFKGTVTNAVTKKNGADVETELELADGLVPLRDNYVNLSYSGKVNRGHIVRDIASQMGLDVVVSPSVSFGDFSMGFSNVGKPGDALRRVCKADNLNWTIQNGILQIVKANQPITNRIYVISTETGLISIPESLNKAASGSDKGGKNKTKYTGQNGWRVVYLLNPAIGINDLIQLKSRSLSGYFRVEKLTMSGDSHGSQWECQAEVLEVK